MVADIAECNTFTPRAAPAAMSGGIGDDHANTLQTSKNTRRSLRAKRPLKAAAAVQYSQQQEQQPDSDSSSDVHGAAETKHFALSTGKQLTSRYRGVCWNRKNKRWQAAINSGGKYIYLGSYTTEDDAARQFDRAAIKIRGKKAKVNFSYSDYVDADGVLVEELVLPAAANRRGPCSEATDTSGNKQQHGNTKPGDSRTAEPVSPQAFALQNLQAGALSPDQLPKAWRQQQCWQEQQQQHLQQHVSAQQQQQLQIFVPSHHSRPEPSMQVVTTGPLTSQHHQLRTGQGPQVTSGSLGQGVTPQLLVPAETPDMYKRVLPPGCSLSFSVIGQDGLFGLVFKCNTTHQQGCGVWTGQAFRCLGVQQDEKAALKTVLNALNLLEQQQHMNTNVADAAAGNHSGSIDHMGYLDSNSTAVGKAFAAVPLAAPAAVMGSCSSLQDRVTAAVPLQAAAAGALLAVDCELPAATGSRSPSSPDSYSSMARCSPVDLQSNAYRGPLLPATASGHVGSNLVTRNLSARLASCELAEALSLAQQAAAEQGISDLAAALKHMSSSSNSGDV